MGIELDFIKEGEMKLFEKIHHLKVQPLFLFQSEFEEHYNLLNKKGRKHLYVHYVAILDGHYEGNIYVSSISINKENLSNQERCDRIHLSSVDFLCERFKQIEEIFERHTKLKKPINLVYRSWITGEFH